MRKPDADENNVQMTDVLCDFCRTEWSEDKPMIEGHQGSCICGNCMRIAYVDVLVNKQDTGPEGYKCTMCLEHRDDPAWLSPMYEDAVICRRCIKLGSGALHKDKQFDWQKPAGADEDG